MSDYRGPQHTRSAWDSPTEPLSGSPPAMPPLPAAPRYTSPAPARPPMAPPQPGRTAFPPAPPYPQTPMAPPVRRAPLPDRSRRLRWGCLLQSALLTILVSALVLTGLAAHRLYDFGRAISSQSPLSTQTGFMAGSQRRNVLIMGFGGGQHDGAYLTDSMMVISLVPSDGATTMVSVPRDLWVQVPPNSGQYAKVNSAYENGLYNGFDGQPAGRLAGGAEAAQKVSEILGIPVPYWVTIDFSGFRQLVDALGGVDVNVPVAFTANYPRNDDPRIDPGWKTIHFNTGPQHMNGEQAIEYARARYVIAPLSEGTDFARSQRQQILLRAILSRARQISAWPGLTDATNALQHAVYTNLSLADLSLFALKMNLSHAAHVGLTDQNVLVNAQSSDGQDILLPANGDWSAISRYVAASLQR